MTTCCEREVGLRHQLKVCADVMRRAGVDHRLRRVFTDDQHNNIANTYEALARKIEFLLDQKSEAA